MKLRGLVLSGLLAAMAAPAASAQGAGTLEFGLFARKNFGLDSMPHDGRHAWARLRPEKIVSWDFRKLAAL